MIRFIFLTCLAFVCTGCFILEEYENASIVESVEEEKERQEIIQDSIIAYLTRQHNEQQSYVPYTFGSLFSTKPKEIIELEQLYEIKSKLPSMQEHYGEKLDSIVQQNNDEIKNKNEEIREKHLYTTYDLTHLYCLKSNNEKVRLIETNFRTYPNNVIKDMEVVFSTSLDNAEYELFEHYIHQDPLVFDDDYNYQKQLNANTYTKLNQSMIESTAEMKEDLLKTILKKVAFYQKNNAFDPEVFTTLLLSEWSNKPTLDIQIDKVIKVSSLKMIKGTSEDNENIPHEFLMGFKKFMLVKGKVNNAFDEEIPLYFEFDKNHVLVGALLVDGEYQKYFE